MSDNQRNEKRFITLKEYVKPIYHESIWPVLSESKEENTFIATEFERIKEDQFFVDPMFEDFNSGSKEFKGESATDAIELLKDEGDFEFAPVEPPAFNNSEPLAADLELVGAVEMSDTSDEEPLSGESFDEHLIEEGEEFIAPTESPPEDEVSEVLVASDEHSSDFLESESEEIAETTTLKADEGELHAAIDGEIFELSPELLQEAYAKGRSETMNEVKQVQSQLEERYALLWEDMQSQLDQLVKLHETKAVELALAVAKRLVGDVVDERRDYIQGVVSQAVQLANGSKILSVRVGPNDFEFLKLSQYAEQTRIILGEGVKFISDESIRAGCVLVTSAGEIDFNLDAAWERIKSRVLSRG
jgi:flagellar assembly protein FliH